MQTINVLQNKTFTENTVNKVVNLQTDQLSADTYYFKPGQVLKFHEHPGVDQIFYFLEGEGKFYLNIDGSNPLVASQVTSKKPVPVN